MMSYFLFFLGFIRFYCLFCYMRLFIWVKCTLTHSLCCHSVCRMKNKLWYKCSFGSNTHWPFIVLSFSLPNEEQAVAQMFIWVKHTLTINCVVILFAEWRTSCGTLSLERLPSSPPPARTCMSTLTSWWELRPWVSVLPVMILYLSITSDIFVCQYWKYCLGISVLKVLSLFLSIASNVSYVSGSVVSNVFESQYCKCLKVTVFQVMSLCCK